MRTRVPVLSLLAALSLSGCTLNTDYFGEYRGVNLLGNYGFDATDGGTPKWALATDGVFMTWEPVTGPVDPDRPTEAVYRLEIKNLIPNGDFEDDAVTPESTVPGDGALQTGWSMVNWDGTPGGLVAVSYSNAQPIANRGLAMTADQSGDQLRVNLNALVFNTTAPVGGWENRAYRFRLDAINKLPTGQIGIKLLGDSAGNSTGNLLLNNETWSLTTRNSDLSGNTTDVFSSSEKFIFPSANPTRILAIGALSAAGGTQEAILDNLRLLPDDRTGLGVVASLPSLESGVKRLLPGTKKGMYVFSFDVKNDPNAGSNNHFAPSLITVQFRAKVKSPPSDPIATFPVPTGGWPSWTTLKFEFGVDFVNSDVDLGGNPALRILISPTSVGSASGDVDVGTILISRPVLTFNP